MSTAEPQPEESNPDVAQTVPFEIGDELTSPTNNTYVVRSIYRGHGGIPHMRLHGQNVQNTMYVPIPRMYRKAHPDDAPWTHKRRAE